MMTSDAQARAGQDHPRATRQAESVPLWRELERVIIDITPKVDKKAPLGKAIHYWTRQQLSLRAFLDDGRFPISNAHVERLLRVVATGPAASPPVEPSSKT